MSDFIEQRSCGKQVLHLPVHSSHRRDRRDKSAFQRFGSHSDWSRSVPVSIAADCVISQSDFSSISGPSIFAPIQRSKRSVTRTSHRPTLRPFTSAPPLPPVSCPAQPQTPSGSSKRASS